VTRENPILGGGEEDQAKADRSSSYRPGSLALALEIVLFCVAFLSFAFLSPASLGDVLYSHAFSELEREFEVAASILFNPSD
jgi:hypothetical protein